MNWLDHDHQKFESAVYQCRTACDTEDWAFARHLFEEFTADYESHVRIEEEVIFPAYETHPGATQEPTASLKADHEQILHLIKHIAQQLDHNDHETLAQDFSLLYRTLTRHHGKEEEIFLPMASDALYTDKDAILANLKKDHGII